MTIAITFMTGALLILLGGVLALLGVMRLGSARAASSPETIRRRSAVRWLVAGGISALVGVVGCAVAPCVALFPYFFPQSYLDDVGANGDRIVVAIRAHERLHGSAPDSLEALVPEFLPEIPDTGFGGWAGWNYGRQHSGDWGLCAQVVSPIGGFDEFIYAPLATARGTERSLPRHGDWVLFFD